MRRSLKRSGFAEAAVDSAIVHLQDQQLLDDTSFAADWVRSRMQFKPRGKRLLEHELRTKGISDENAAAATTEVDDEATAFALASRRAALMRGLDRQTFIRRLSNYLLARGYSRETISRAVNSVLTADDDS